MVFGEEMTNLLTNFQTTTPGYSHTQKAPLCLILYGSALACFVLVSIVGETPGIYIGGGVGLLIALLAPAFHHLTVVNQGDRLAIRFGPLPLFRRTVRYADIEKVEVGRTLILEGWGIHYSVRGGWVWNLWGRDCVVVHCKNGAVLRIGTDDASEPGPVPRSEDRPARNVTWRKNIPRLKLGKRASFVKTHLKQLPQEKETWEVDFRALAKTAGADRNALPGAGCRSAQG